MNEIEKMILAELQKLHSKDTLRGIDVHSERLMKEYLSKRRLEIRKDKLTDQNGRMIDLASDLELLADASHFIARRSDALEKARYVSKFERPSKEIKDKITKQMEDVFRKLVKINSVVPKDQANFDRALDILAANFIYEYTSQGEEIEDATGMTRESPGGQLIFAKLTDGLTGKRRYSFDDLLGSIGHLIDHERTGLAKRLKESELKAIARKLLDKDKPKPEEIKQQMEILQKHEVLSTIPARRLPFIPPSEIQRETIRREAILRNLNPDDVFKGGGQLLANLTRQAKTEYDALDNVNAIQTQLTAIQPQAPAEYQGLSY